MKKKAFNTLCFLIFISIVTYPIPEFRISEAPLLIFLLLWLAGYTVIFIFCSIEFDGKFKVTKSKDELIFYSSIFFIVVSLMFTQMLHGYPNYRSVLNTIAFLLLMVLMTNLKIGTYGLEKIYRVLILTGICLTLYGYYGYVSQNVGTETQSDVWLNYSRYFGIHYTPSTRNSDAHFIAIPLVLLFSKIFYARRIKLKIFDTLVFLLLFTALVLSFSRSAWVAFLISTSYLILRKKGLKKYVKILLLVPSLLFIGYTALRYFEMGRYFVGKILSLIDSEKTKNYLMEITSNRDRGLLLKNGVKLFFDNPFGVGLDNIRYHEFHNSARIPYHVENNYLNVLIELGFGGFLAFFTIWFYPLFKIILKRRITYVEAGMQGMIIYMLVVMIFNVETLNFYHWMVYSVIWMAHFNSRKTRRQRERV